MKILIMILIFATLADFCYGQASYKRDEAAIKRSVVGFLNWYKINGDRLQRTPIITGFNEDSLKKDSTVKINMKAVEEYLNNIKTSEYVSNIFLNTLRTTYKNVLDTLDKHPLKDYFGPISGLEADLILGFEPEEVLDYINKGIFTKVYIIDNKALIRFKVSKFCACIFTLTKDHGKWLIDTLNYDSSFLNKVNIKP